MRKRGIRSVSEDGGGKVRTGKERKRKMTRTNLIVALWLYLRSSAMGEAGRQGDEWPCFRLYRYSVCEAILQHAQFVIGCVGTGLDISTKFCAGRRRHVLVFKIRTTHSSIKKPQMRNRLQFVCALNTCSLWRRQPQFFEIVTLVAHLWKHFWGFLAFFFVAELPQKKRCFNRQEFTCFLSTGVVTASSHALWCVLWNKVIRVLGQCWVDTPHTPHIQNL